MFIDENYSQEKIIINTVWANVCGIIVLIVTLAVFGTLFRLLHENITEETKFSIYSIIFGSKEGLLNSFVFLLIMITGIIFHELIHGLFFALYSKNKFKSVKFGILPKEKLFTPYCHCKEKLKINHYRIAAIMPTIILGIIPAVISLNIGNIVLLVYGILFISAGSGDLLMIMKLIKEKNDVFIYDLPDDVGFIVYRPNL
jgi:hypothetical protein